MLYRSLQDVQATITSSSTVKPKWIFLVILLITQLYFLIDSRHKNWIKFETSSFRYILNTQSVREPGRTVYVITATYQRPLQVPELTRMSQTLMLVPDLVWIVVNGVVNDTGAVEALLRRTRLNYVYMTDDPTKVIPDDDNFSWSAVNKNRGLEWVKANASSGVFFFADDDNTYDIRLFEEMRSTQKVSIWPVGFLSGWWFESPIVSNGSLVGFHGNWKTGREWPVDMAGFAVSVEFLKQRLNAKVPCVIGSEENGFLQSLSPLTIADIELKANNCSELLVWHTQTVSPNIDLSEEKAANEEGNNILQLYSSLRVNLNEKFS